MTLSQGEELAYLTIAEAGARFRTGELSPVALTQNLLERIERTQPVLRAFITLTADLALQQAQVATQQIAQGDPRPLLGIPLAYKDIYMTAGIRTTGGSALYEQWVPTTTATPVAKLQQAGAILMGKLSTHEFALGLSTEDHPFPPARNPWNPEHIPGGSSSGSGVSAAAGLVLGALGSDTGGSIRHPAAVCGIAGIKPTYGRCSRYGVLPLAWSLDHTGPMARTCPDLALLLTAMSGYDPQDPGSAQRPAEDFSLGLDQGIRGLRIGVLRSWYETADAPVITAVDQAAQVLQSLGAEVREVEIPHLELSACLWGLLLAEAYAYHADPLSTRPECYPAWLRNRFLLGKLFSAEEYLMAQRARRLLIEETQAVMHQVDVLLSPTRGGTAMTFDQAYQDYFAQVSYTGFYNMTGFPALSILCGFDQGLPIGLQLGGRPFEEATLLRVGHTYEQVAGWIQHHPTV